MIQLFPIVGHLPAEVWFGKLELFKVTQQLLSHLIRDRIKNHETNTAIRGFTVNVREHDSPVLGQETRAGTRDEWVCPYSNLEKVTRGLLQVLVLVLLKLEYS